MPKRRDFAGVIPPRTTSSDSARCTTEEQQNESWYTTWQKL